MNGGSEPISVAVLAGGRLVRRITCVAVERVSDARAANAPYGLLALPQGCEVAEPSLHDWGDLRGGLLVFCRRGQPWRRQTRGVLERYLAVKAGNGVSRPRGDAAWVTRCGGACQAGEARALAAAARRVAAQPQAWAAGHADAIAMLRASTSRE
jgi:hypothetical protein